MPVESGIEARFVVKHTGFTLDVDLALPGRGVSGLFGDSGGRGLVVPDAAHQLGGGEDETLAKSAPTRSAVSLIIRCSSLRSKFTRAPCG